MYETEEWYREFLGHLKKEMPDLPQFKPSDDNTDQWKHDSGIRTGYELLLNKIDPYGGN